MIDQSDYLPRSCSTSAKLTETNSLRSTETENRHELSNKKRRLSMTEEEDTDEQPDQPISAKRVRLARSSEDCNIESCQPRKLIYWLALDVITAGRQGIDLGRDQTPIVHISAVLGSFNERKVIDRFEVSLRPESFTLQSNVNNSTEQKTVPHDRSDHQVDFNWVNNCQQKEVSNRAKVIVPISLEAMKAADWNHVSQLPGPTSPSLPEAMLLLTTWLSSHNVPVGELPEDAQLLVITDGHVPIRNVIHPQAAYLDIDSEQRRRTPWCLYINVLDWFRRANINTMSSTDLGGAVLALDASDCNSEQTDAHHLSKVEQIAKLTCLLLSKDVPMCDLEVVRIGYEHRVFPRTIQLEDACILEVRQVPWGASPSNIACFFSGLNVIPGGVAIRLTEGRRSNTAIVAFDSLRSAQLALGRHQHHFCYPLFPDMNVEWERNSKDSQSGAKPVLLQIYSSSAREFIQCAGCDQPVVAQFLNQLTNGDQVVVRVRGLPYTATKQQILSFFAEVNAPVLLDAHGIYLVANSDGRPTGDAFILFDNDKIASRALLRHKEYLGDRYVELFKASPSEMVQVCYNVSQSPHQQQQQQQQHSGSTIQKLTTIPTESQAHLRNVLRLNASNLTGLTPYLLQNPNPLPAFSQIKSPMVNISPLSNNLLSHNIFPFGLTSGPLLPNAGTLVSNMGLSNALAVTMASNLLSGSSACQTRVPQTSACIGTPGDLVDLSRDPKDPTDPDCPYARPLPPNGVSAMIQLSGLPLDTPRHDIRLYLGPVNMAKVYRMRRIEPKPDQTTSNWLISVSNTAEAIQLIRDLVHRNFNLTSLPGSAMTRTIPNLPQFSLYHVGPDKTPIPIPLTDPNIGIPLNRIYGLDTECGTQQEDAKSTEHSVTTKDANLSIVNPMLSSEALQNRIIQNLIAQNQLGSPQLHATKGIVPLPSVVNGAGATTVPFIHGVPQITLGTTTPLLSTQPALCPTPQALSTELTRLVAPTTALAGLAQSCCMVVVTGAPIDSTPDELVSVFHPIRNLLSAPPRFTLLQANANGTANLLAIFATPIEAQIASLCCPSGTMRNQQYVVGVASLVPQSAPINPSSTLIDMTAPTQLDPTNLMLFQTPISNPGLMQ